MTIVDFWLFSCKGFLWLYINKNFFRIFVKFTLNKSHYWKYTRVEV